MVPLFFMTWASRCRIVRLASPVRSADGVDRQSAFAELARCMSLIGSAWRRSGMAQNATIRSLRQFGHKHFESCRQKCAQIGGIGSARCPRQTLICLGLLGLLVSAQGFEPWTY